MRAFPRRCLSAPFRLVLLCAAFLLCAGVTLAQSQSDAADLGGFVRDPSGAVVAGATVTARNTGTNFTRNSTTNDDGFYQMVNLPPGTYEITVEAANFKKALLPEVKLTVGQRADIDIPLEVGAIGETVTVSGTTGDVIETSRTAVANTIEQQRIENLPINERSATGFALTISTVGRDNGRPIGPAPSSGLNIGGQRGRSTLVQVDGADNTDNSVNAARSTVSQEAVQEYQVATNSYAPEFGRAIGGIVNVVTKGGTNEFRGNLFGFIRHKSIQSRNALAPLINNDPGEKPPFTRAQFGGTFGGPIKKDRTFFFFSYEGRRRQESGFFTSDVASGLNGSLAVGPGTPFPVLPFNTTYSNLTPAQVAFITGEFASGNTARIARAITYATLASAGGQTGLNGFSSVRSPGGAIPAGTIIGPRFFLTGAPIPSLANNNILPGFTTVNANGDPIAFRALNSLARVFPISESTNYFSIRGDHQFNQNQQFNVRFGYNPSRITGIQDESQNQTLGQNDFSRTGIQDLKDTSLVAALTSTLTNNIVNEARFNFGHRNAKFDSQTPGTAIQISGAAFIGSNPFSPVNRKERRFAFTDNVNWVVGNHNFKFGGDVNLINVTARFDLNFPGLFNFGAFDANPFIGTVAGQPLAPALTPVQSYGAGTPGVFIEGFGNPNSSLQNKPLAFFVQDSWKIRKNVTLNYGLRYDVELTQTIPTTSFRDPLSGINLTEQNLQTAQDVVGVQQGFPRDTNNFAPRAGIAWDVTNDGKTVVRASLGLFYDHPLLAVAFNSDIGDAAQQQQFTTFLPGNPAPTSSLNLLQLFQGTVCSTASMNPLCPGGLTTPGVAPSAQYLPGRIRFNDQTFAGFGPVLPFTLAVAKDFQYASATEGSFTIERQIGKDMSISGSYLFVGAHHLPHPQDINAPRTDLLIENFRRFAGRNPNNNSEALAFSLPTACPGAGCPPGFVVIIPGLVGRNALGQGVVQPFAANFFRPSAPNYFFAQAASGGLVTPAAFNAALAVANTLRTPGPISPFGDVSAQLSDGNSSYNAMNLEMRKRFSNNFQFLASYTWSHSIDDSSDLQTLLKPQDNRNFRAERSDSLFDQRHRFVFSGVLIAPEEWRSSSSTWHRILSDFTVAPILEISSGRPFNIITGTDSNGDLQSSNDRPSVAADGTLFIPTTPFTNGNLRRNAGITHGYASLDMRLTRAIRFGERVRVDLIAEGFNLFNRFNEASANPFFSEVNSFRQTNGGLYYSRPTAAYDPRQFQFGVKIYF
ncbi:MAG: TonB-dependent receptor [Acidobacteria bacterium]|nr:TonB-dependent receptor [Acidobacteriota bacterium]